MTAPGSIGIDPGVQIGHVHLRVSDLERATVFYRDVLGFHVTGSGVEAGLPLTLLSANDYHHQIALNTFRSAGGTPPPPGHTGLHHVAIVYPDRTALGRAVARLGAHGHPIDGVEDHGATVSVYLRDPDGNGLELYYDRPASDWYGADGKPVWKAVPLDPASLLR